MAQVDSENSTAAPGGSPAGELYTPTPVTPEEAFQAIGRLRKEARDAIDNLIRFLDKTDNYVSRELEDDGDQGDASYPEGGARLVSNPNEDDEDTGDAEPSLGSSGHGSGGSISYSSIPISDGFQMVYDCEGDEHDGAEPENEHGDGNPDDEPSLGWTIDGMTGNQTGDDRELQNHAGVMPQDRTGLGTGVTAETSYRRFVCGLTPEQERAFREAMRAGNTNGVLVR